MKLSKAQAPRLMIAWACPKCASQNTTPIGSKHGTKYQCNRCYEQASIDIERILKR